VCLCGSSQVHVEFLLGWSFLVIHRMFWSLEYLETEDVKAEPHVQQLHDSLLSQKSAVEVCMLSLSALPVLQSKHCNDVFRKENTRKIRRVFCFNSTDRIGTELKAE
jgi:hypothetical protein